ncbi:MAG: hypothetical protein H6707_12790 [Deltaproteobacteria bacterium]|nr:hypothetical protein [Deltaproteobacteria bacterium]
MVLGPTSDLRFRWMRILLALLAVAIVSLACTNEIGDSCNTNVDCSPNGDRICDTTQPDGYCTIEGCGDQTCPEEAVCVRFFPAAFLSVACDPQTEDSVASAVTPTNHCTRDEICLSSGRCAPLALERRYCMLACGENNDCRSGYECRATGAAGAESVATRAEPLKRSRFCAAER